MTGEIHSNLRRGTIQSRDEQRSLLHFKSAPGRTHPESGFLHDHGPSERAEGCSQHPDALPESSGFFQAALYRVADIDTPWNFNVQINVIAFLFLAAVGVLFGYTPARRAARLNLIDALRHE